LDVVKNKRFKSLDQGVLNHQNKLSPLEKLIFSSPKNKNSHLSKNVLFYLFHNKNKKPVLIQEETLENKLPFINFKSKFYKKIYSSPVFLTSGGKKCQIKKFLDTCDSVKLSEFGNAERVVIQNPSIIKKILGLILVPFGFLGNSIFNPNKLLRLVVKEKEISLNVNTSMCLYGEFKFKNGVLSAHKIDYFGKNLYGILKELEKSIFIRYAGITVLSSVLTYFIFKKFIKKNLERKLKQKEKEKKQHEEKLEELGEKVLNDFKCIICFNRPRNILYEPCKHLIACNVCIEEMRETEASKPKCIMCKQNISNQIYLDIIENK
jgi:hypothetical protein